MLHMLLFTSTAFATIILAALIVGKLSDLTFRWLTRFFVLILLSRWSGK